MIGKYLAAETDRLSQKFLDGATTLAAWQEKRPRLQREYFDMLGLWPLPEKTPLEAKVTGQLEAYGVVVEKLHYQSKPGLYVTANLYRPKKVDRKLPAILYVCGHSNRGRDGNKSAYQDHGFWFANNGYVCLVLDSLQLGEIAGIHHGTYGLRSTKPVETRFWWHAAGYTPAGVECWNGVRGIDYLLTRPEVDPERIGVTGISGGGAATFWIAAADDRVKVAVPVSGMSDLESYVKNKVINGHCDCMFFYNTYQWDWTTIAALVAPRPLLFANSDDDKIFPMDGNRRIIDKLRKLYRLYDRPELVDEYVSVGGHAYRPDLRVAVFKFINKHLKGDTTSPVSDSDKYAELPGKELRVFPEDSDLPKAALNGRIDESFVPRAKVDLPSEGKFAEWKVNLMQGLKNRCFRSLPETVPAANEVERGNNFVTLESEPGIRYRLVWVNGEKFEEPATVFFYVPGQADPSDWCYKVVGEDYGWALYPRLGWARQSPPNYVERAHVLLGHTVDEGRLRDFLAAVRLAKRPVRVAGVGKAGILAAYAALFEPALKEVIVVDPPTSHTEGPYFLGVLRVLDVPDVLGMLAPMPLTIIGGDATFDRTAEIYRRAGAENKLRRE